MYWLIFLRPDSPSFLIASSAAPSRIGRAQWNGGGVWARSAKSITLSPEARAALDIGAETLTPTELIRAILTAPVELVYNGGIGTYIKAASQTDAAVGDRANDAVRVNGGELRCKVFGEDGKVTRPVKGATLIGNGPDCLTRVSMIGNDLALDPGVGTCGKDGQSVPVGVGQPTLRIDGLTVGGTGA